MKFCVMLYLAEKIRCFAENIRYCKEALMAYVNNYHSDFP